MDFLTLEYSKGGFEHILVITDHFTRFTQAVPTRNMSAKTTAEAFFQHFVVHYGLPQRIHSDQGGNLESRLLKELCSITGIVKSCTTPYHAMGNGQCERFNRTLLNMLGTLEPEQKRDWKQFVGPLVHAYNSTRYETTGQSPFYLMFGREPRLPIDLAFGINNNDEHQSLTQYVTSLRDRLKRAYELASSTVETSQQRQKKNYDLKVRGATIQTGDRVLVRVLAFSGRHKLADKWEQEPYIVTDQPNLDIPVYRVQREDGGGRERTLHRNLLLPIGSLPYSTPEVSDKEEDKPVQRSKPVPRPRPRKSKSATNPSISTSDADVQEDDDDSSEIAWYVEIRPGTGQLAGAGVQDDTSDVVSCSNDAVSQTPGDDHGVVETGDVNPEGDAQSSGGEESGLHPGEIESDADTISEAGQPQADQPTEDVVVPDQLTEDVVVPDQPIEDVEPDQSAEDEEDSTQQPPPDVPEAQRTRPARDRKPPGWMRSGEFVLAQQVQQPEWAQKASYVASLMQSGMLDQVELKNKALDAILSILSQ